MIRALVLALTLAAPSYAELVPAQFRDFSLGLNDSADPTNLDPRSSPDLLNVVIDDPVGSIKPRNGLLLCGNLPSGSVATELYPYSKADGTRYMIAADNTNVYQTQDCITWTRIVTGQTATFKPSFATVRDKLWFVNGSTHAYTWDGATTTILDGRSNTPNPSVPRGRYIEFWRDRVWIARTLADPSIVAFSALTDSSGNDLDPSTGTTSWPATNAFYVDRDGGSAIHGIKAHRDNLYVFKENGIWRIDFNNDYDNRVVKTLSNVGSRFGTSIVELDNYLLFMGPDGIYAFDGDTSARISDKIEQRFRSISQPVTSEETKIWTDANDFDDGTFNLTTEKDSAGAVTLSSDTFKENCEDGNTTSGPAWTATSGGSQCSAGALRPNSNGFEIYAPNTVSTGSYTFSVYGNQASLIVDTKFISNGTGLSDPGYALRFQTNVTGLTAAVTLIEYPGATTLCSANSVEQVSSTKTYTVTRSPTGHFKVFRNGVVECEADDTTTNNSSHIVLYSNGSGAFYDDLSFHEYLSSGSHTTDIYQAVSMSSWSVFDADYTSNLGALTFDIRVGSDTGAVQAASWQSITPGSLVPGATWQNYVQVRSNITAGVTGSDFIESPSLNSVSVSYLKGGSQSNPVYGAKWKNRYWLSANSSDFPSTLPRSYSWDTAADWTDSSYASNVDTYTYSGYITAKTSLYTHDAFADGDFTSAPSWYKAAGTWSAGTVGGRTAVSANANAGASGNALFSSATFQGGATGRWQFKHYYTNSTEKASIPGFSGGNYYGMVFEFINNATSYTSPAGAGGAYVLQATSTASGNDPPIVISLSTTAFGALTSAWAKTIIASHTFAAGAYSSGTWHSYQIERSPWGEMTVYWNGTRILQATDTAISSSSRIMIAGNDIGSTDANSFTDIKYATFPASAEWVSQVKSDGDTYAYNAFGFDAAARSGLVAVSYRTAPSASSLSSIAFSTVTSGTIIPGASDYFQWRVLMTPTGSDSPLVSSATVNYVNRELDTSGVNNMVLINSKYDRSAWVPHDLLIGPMATFSNNFYAAASTHSAVYRMDYGTNDAGQLIPWYWTSRDETWGAPNNRKSLLELTVDYRKASSASSVQVGYSRDQGSTFSNSTVDMSGTGRASSRRFVNGGNGYDYRLRFGSTQLDAAPTIIGITGWADIRKGTRD